MVKGSSNLGNTNTGAFLFSNTKSCMNGGGHGVTMTSLKNDSNAGLGRGYNTAVQYSNCTQKGGNMADVNNNSMTNSYGYVDGNNKTNSMFRGSYAPVTSHETNQKCGGRKKKRRRRRKSKKTRKSRKNKRRTRYSKSKKRKTRSRRLKTKKTRRRRRRRKQKGGSSINYSVIDNNLTGDNARILGTHSYSTSDNCGDGYNHFTKGNTPSLY